MRKIFTLFFAASTLLGAATLSSCKDDEEPNYPVLNDEDSNTNIENFAFQPFPDGTATLYGIVGSLNGVSVDLDAIEEIVVPNYVNINGNNFTVRYVNWDGFKACRNVKRITVNKFCYYVDPDKLKMFEKLEQLNVHPDNTTYFSDNGVVYRNNPNSTLSPYDLCFVPAGYSGKLVIPEGTSSVERHAAEKCSKITEVSFPTSMRSIEFNAFTLCTGLKEVEINNTTSLNVEVFTEAFSYCDNLETVKIPKLARVGAYAFSNCKRLKNFNCAPYHLLDYAFYNCNALTDFNFSNVKDIQEGAFAESGLTKAELPEIVEEIGKDAFLNCSELESVVFNTNAKTGSASITNIGDGCFSGCTALKSLNVPNSVKDIGDDAFKGCSNLDVVIMKDNSYIRESNAAFSDCKSVSIGK